MITTAWYHVVMTWDTNNSTSGDRGIIYVNGTRVTAFGTETYPSQNVDWYNKCSITITCDWHIRTQ